MALLNVVKGKFNQRKNWAHTDKTSPLSTDCQAWELKRHRPAVTPEQPSLCVSQLPFSMDVFLPTSWQCQTSSNLAFLSYTSSPTLLCRPHNDIHQGSQLTHLLKDAMLAFLEVAFVAPGKPPRAWGSSWCWSLLAYCLSESCVRYLYPFLHLIPTKLYEESNNGLFLEMCSRNWATFWR